MRRVLVSMLVAAAAFPGAAAADGVVATVDAPTPLSAYAGTLLWSQRDPATGRFALMSSAAGGSAAALPVAQRTVPFDATLGPGPGALTAVYSRCAREATATVRRQQASGMPAYTRGVGCKLYRYDFATRTEARIGRTPRGASDVLPSLWRGRLAFARVRDSRRSFPYVYEGPIGGPVRRMPGGRRTSCSIDPTRGRVCGDRRRSMPTALALRGRHLAFTWQFQGTLDAPGSEVRLVDTRTRASRRLDYVRGGGLTSIVRTAAGWDGTDLHWARLCLGDESGCPHRAGLVEYQLARARFAIAPIRPGDLWQASTAGITYVLRDPDYTYGCRSDATPSVPSCQIVSTTPVFTRF
jgi:hypothetical protein